MWFHSFFPYRDKYTQPVLSHTDVVHFTFCGVCCSNPLPSCHLLFILLLFFNRPMRTVVLSYRHTIGVGPCPYGFALFGHDVIH